MAKVSAVDVVCSATSKEVLGAFLSSTAQLRLCRKAGGGGRMVGQKLKNGD